MWYLTKRDYILICRLFSGPRTGPLSKWKVSNQVWRGQVICMRHRNWRFLLMIGGCRLIGLLISMLSHSLVLLFESLPYTAGD